MIIKDVIEAQAEAVADVLENHEVFGRPGTDHAFYAKQDFISMVSKHAEKQKNEPLEITYWKSAVRVIINTKIVDGVAAFRDIVVVNYPRINPSTIDYEELNEDIQELYVFNDLG